MPRPDNRLAEGSEIQALVIPSSSVRQGSVLIELKPSLVNDAKYLIKDLGRISEICKLLG